MRINYRNDVINRSWTLITMAAVFLLLSASAYAIDLEIGCSGGIGFISVPDWWLAMESSITSGLDLRLDLFGGSMILEGAYTRVWNAQEWWNFNPNIWSFSIEGNTGKIINPRLGLDYYTGYSSRYGLNVGFHYIPSKSKRLSFSILTLIRFEDVNSGHGFGITSQPRGIFASIGLHYKW